MVKNYVVRVGVFRALSERKLFMILPYSTSSPGIQGKIKEQADHFIVSEIPAYLPSGEGEHIYVTTERENLSTKQVIQQISKAVGISERDIGYAGLKDKQARTIQTFSLYMPTADIEEVVSSIQKEFSGKILDFKRHGNKLRRGHLAGNKFEILVTNSSMDMGLVSDILIQVKEQGIPNYYGEQRFGGGEDNWREGKELLRGKKKRCSRWLRELLISSYQSYLFNHWLKERIEANFFTELITGDIAQTPSGGLFEVEDLSAEIDRFRQREICYTGPIFGFKMKFASGQAGKWEKEIWDQEELEQEYFSRAKAKGTRRRGIIHFSDESIVAEKTNGGVLFCFSLPPGSYATVVLREFMKNSC